VVRRWVCPRWWNLLVEVVADGFTLYCCGPKTAPNALVACYEWKHEVDLLTVRNFDWVTTARVLKRGRVDIFAPEVVVWTYEGSPQYALQALLRLVHPAHPDAPAAGYPAPASLQVPRSQQRPMTIQPPAPGRARVRATRLATAMTHGGDRAPLRRSGRETPGWLPVEQAAPDARSWRPTGHQRPADEG
jgi:hypothetical protein